ncbi:MAG: hypothetical protein IJC89_05150 [Clostridia bacterium]|nr:hypothetical protein [Clostridia bacterium]
MTVEKILAMVDSLAPNNCTKEQKLYWFNQCESIIKEKAIKSYKYIETEFTGGIVKLPEGYTSWDIEAVYINGRLIDKLDFRSGFTGKFSKEKEKVGIVLKERHEEITETTYEGDIYFNGDKITMNSHKFLVGDSIDIESVLFTGRVTVLGSNGDDIYVNHTFDINDCEGVVKKSLNIPTLCKAPYDKLYIDYIMAQMDYYNKDYEGYNNNSYMFNELLDTLIRKSSSNNSGTRSKQMRGIW